jgi:hypothetical protein
MVDLALGVVGDLTERFELVFGVVSEESQFLSVVVETFLALGIVSGDLDAL